MYKYDVVIVGGGPSGLSCAIELQKMGISSCVIEKDKYPRNKLCGGLITEKTYRELNELLGGDLSLLEEKTFVDETNVVSIWDRDQMKCKTPVNYKLRFVDRMLFDYSLKNYYTSIGGVAFDGETVLKCDFTNKVIGTDKGEYEYHLLIVADGANSQIRKRLSLSLNHMGFCLETVIPKSGVSLDNSAQIHFGVLKNGYAWVFPCGNYYKIGFGNRFDKSFNYLKVFHEYLSIIGITESENAKVLGAFVPYGGYLKRPIANGSVLFVGDAAGMVDPIYGEGLYFSLRSGKTLAKSIKNGQISGFSPDRFYTNIMPDLNYIRTGVRLRNIFFNPLIQHRFLRTVSNHEASVMHYIDNQVSLYKYSHSKSWKAFFD